jgi:hypothetical protein
MWHHSTDLIERPELFEYYVAHDGGFFTGDERRDHLLGRLFMVKGRVR